MGPRHFAIFIAPALNSVERLASGVWMKDRIGELKSSRILVIESLESVLGIAKFYLERRGYDVATVTSAADALAAILSEPDSFALVIAPLNMPERSGAELAEEIESLHSDLPIVLVNSPSLQPRVEYILPKSVRAVLKSPVCLAGLEEIVQQVLAPHVKPGD